MPRCPHCSAELETPLACGACGRLIDPEREPTPFECLGLVPGLEVDPADLRKRLVRASRLTHPDFFGNHGEELRALAERNTARLNAAFETLSEPARRADWIVRSLGGPDENAERAMPKAFLLEVLEWNELLEEARADREDPGLAARLAELGGTLREKRAEALAALERILDPLPPPGSPKLREARTELNAIRYVDRALEELETLRLARAAAR
jgi:molecular chaperone HscB